MQKKSLKQIPMQDLDAYLTSLSDKANCAKSEKYEPPGMANGNIPQQHSTYFFSSFNSMDYHCTYLNQRSSTITQSFLSVIINPKSPNRLQLHRSIPFVKIQYCTLLAHDISLQIIAQIKLSHHK